MKSFAPLELVEKAMRGEPPDVESLIEAVWPDAYRLAYAVLGERQSAEDVAQEACVVVYRTIASLRSAAAFRVWFYAVRSPRRVARIASRCLDRACETVGDHFFRCRDYCENAARTCFARKTDSLARWRRRSHHCDAQRNDADGPYPDEAGDAYCEQHEIRGCQIASSKLNRFSVATAPPGGGDHKQPSACAARASCASIVASATPRNFATQRYPAS